MTKWRVSVASEPHGGTDRRIRPARGVAIGKYQQLFGPNQQQAIIEEVLSDPQMGSDGKDAGAPR
jgi:hypothetical protein